MLITSQELVPYTLSLWEGKKKKKQLTLQTINTQPTLPNLNKRFRINCCPLHPLSPTCCPHVSSHMPPIKGHLPCKKVPWCSFLFIPLKRPHILSLGHIHFEALENCFVKTKNWVMSILKKLIYEEQLKKLGIIFLETRNFEGNRVTSWLCKAKKWFLWFLRAWLNQQIEVSSGLRTILACYENFTTM